MQFNRTAVLVILDGFGINHDTKHNAIASARTPTWDKLWTQCPHTELNASESFVGLPSGFMGNSEVGHLNIGAGRVVYQDFSLISNAIEKGQFFKNAVFTGLFDKIQEGKKALHLVGLVSDGGVHSHISHLFALLRMAKDWDLPKVYIHVITDGRDCSPTSGLGFVKKLENYIDEQGKGEIATVSGRFYTMDRDKRWERTGKAYETLLAKDKEPTFLRASQYVESQYDKNITDEFIVPAHQKNYKGVQDGDGVLFFNFRADRARQLTQAFTEVEFPAFTRSSVPKLCGFASLTPYGDQIKSQPAFEKTKVSNTLGEFVSRNKGKQLRIAETEKYAHVTYFFSGGQEKEFEGEVRLMIPSPKEVLTYDLKPEMSAPELTKILLQELDKDYDLVVVNYANCDMVGHTGNIAAAIKAVETVDHCLKKIVDWVEKNNAFMILTADHGNVEKMQDDTGQPLTSHTLHRVPLVILESKGAPRQLREDGRLCDVAPTLIDMWGEKPPKEMTGSSLLGA